MSSVHFVDNSAAALNQLKGATKSAARIIGGMIRNYAKGRLDAAKGPLGGAWRGDDITALKDSITVKVEEGPVLYVGSNMEIAPYIELGTGKLYEPSAEWIEYHGDDRHSVGGLDSWIYFDELEGVFKVGMPVPAQPYLRPAVLDHVDEYKKVVQKELERA